VVEIVHDLHFRVSVFAPIVEPIIGNGFIHPVATKTLHSMKAYLEKNNAPI
jgi:hypothetical protein